jgi:hypothetical protein
LKASIKGTIVKRKNIRLFSELIGALVNQLKQLNISKKLGGTLHTFKGKQKDLDHLLYFQVISLYM